MKELIESLGLTKSHSQEEVEQSLLDIRDFSSDWRRVKDMNCNSYIEASQQIYKHLQSNKI